MTMKRSWIAVFATVVCLTFAWATGAGRPHPASAGGVIDPTCTSSLPCIEYDNNSTGPGIRGISVAGNGFAGSTKNHSTSASNGRAGLIGNDVGTGTFNSGVHGLSVSGTGVSGNSTSGAGVSGISTSGTGVTAQSTFGFGLLAKSIHGQGVFGTSSTNDGVDGVTTNPSKTRGTGQVGVFGADNSTDGGSLDRGVEGVSTKGVGVEGFSPASVGVNAIGGADLAGIFLPALSVVGNGAGDLIDACQTTNPCDSVHSLFAVDGLGDVILDSHADIITGTVSAFDTISSFGNFNIEGSGQYQKHGTCVAGCTVATTATAGRAAVTYAPMVSQPTVEDFGEAQLVNGQTSVRLDPKFANVVDQRANYLVFITPEGDANVLYVTQKSPGGFTVRESHGGRSTLMFSYRIVAKPFGSRGARLPMVELPKLRSSSPKHRAWHPGGVVPVH